MAEESEKEVMFMNREISKMPCFRETFLYSISSGLAVGLIHFMLTSKVQRSSHLAFGTYGCVTLAYWSYCRYNFSKQKFHMSKIQSAMKNHALYEGTEMEKQIKKID
ncbi:cytochrome c oxidase assembly protein COX20, mitochondrial isoform X1 [Cherax quadricarinatus]|uniref:cytochrome c oxidase assembly protein COX20, mitochondrial isoform X1 n=1 Tax=Cherax quadricarinatus TaxID=27406 RepID=UPI0023794CBB|nr:cytochrome c oxidase assembly protein COX20, mitochondrial-like isoform X1 [Cherax quadricarinatus]